MDIEKKKSLKYGTKGAGEIPQSPFEPHIDAFGGFFFVFFCVDKLD